MSKSCFKVNVLRKEFTHSSLPAMREASGDSLGYEVLSMLSAFTTWLEESISDVGFLFRGPNQTVDTGWAAEYLVCLYRPWPKMGSIPDCKNHVPSGEIFESTDDIYYASVDKLIALESEVLIDFYSGEHGLHVGDLETDLRRRLKRACMVECHSLGFSRPAARDIALAMVEELTCLSPNSWTWSAVQEEILTQVEAYASARRGPYTWMVRERLDVRPEVPWYDPTTDGDLIREAIPAMDEDDDNRQWLILAQPLLESIRLPCPEFESVRPLREGELFHSERGLYYHTRGSLIELGEIATALLHERHGECLIDAESLIREEVVRLLLARIEGGRPLMPDQYARVVDAAHEIATETDVLSMWYQHLDEMVDELKKTLRK